MPHLTSEDLQATCEQYVSLVGAEDVDAMMDLFADDCRVEDPVGAEPRVGRDDVRALYQSLPAMGTSAKLVGPVHAVPDAGAAAFSFQIDTAGMVIEAIDVMAFDDHGKITSMTAYWRM